MGPLSVRRTVIVRRNISRMTPLPRWNAALALASYLDSNQGIYKDRCVLELGAGGALPSIVSVINGAKKVG